MFGTAQEANEEGIRQFNLREDNIALSCFEKAIRLDSSDPVFYNNKGQTLIKLKQYDKAEDACNTALQLLSGRIDQRNQMLINDTKKLLAVIYNQQGLSMYSQNNIAGAYEKFKKAVKYDPTKENFNMNKEHLEKKGYDCWRFFRFDGNQEARDNCVMFGGAMKTDVMSVMSSLNFSFDSDFREFKTLQIYSVSHPAWWENSFKTKVNDLVEVYGIGGEFNRWTDYKKGSVVYQGQRVTVLDAFKQQTRSFGNRFNIASPGVRWVFGWHGTSLGSAIKISAGGFDTSGSHKCGTWFGAGNYFATSVKYSYEYANKKSSTGEVVWVVSWLPLVNPEVLDQPLQMRSIGDHPYKDTEINSVYDCRVVPVSPNPQSQGKSHYDTPVGEQMEDFEIVMPFGHCVMPRFMVRLKKEDAIIDPFRENFADTVKHALGGQTLMYMFGNVRQDSINKQIENGGRSSQPIEVVATPSGTNVEVLEHMREELINGVIVKKDFICKCDDNGKESLFGCDRGKIIEGKEKLKDLWKSKVDSGEITREKRNRLHALCC